MHKEHNRWYADWYDKKGKRRRKAFLTAEEATTYEAQQKAVAHPKNKGPALKSLLSSEPTSKRGSRKERTLTAAAQQCSTSVKPLSTKPGKRALKTSPPTT